ncbi:MAG: Gfo/Idh/MocA family oxidoreductase [Kiritimatiellaeota bacterium]|nr:Gfo/Idh/MocA family oxidoreductase [Kiritimatiellota bacterium]
MKKVGCAVIGFGGMGAWHTDRLRELKTRFDLAGVYDIKPERNAAARERGIHAYASMRELLADAKVDFVVIATPNDAHKKLAIAALKAGKHVLCEKPVAMNVRELEDMIAAAKKYGRLFTVHQNRRWDPDYLTAKRILDANTLGPLFHIESRVQGSRGIPGDWRNQKRHGGGMVLDWGIHLLDQALMMTLPRTLKSVYAQLTNVTNEECDDGFRAHLTFDDGLTFMVEVGTSHFITLPRWYLLGVNGSAVVRGWECDGEIVKVSDWENRDAVPIQAGAGLTKTMAPRTDDTIRHEPLSKAAFEMHGYYANLYDALVNGTPIDVTCHQQRRLMRLIETIFLSARRRQAIAVTL